LISDFIDFLEDHYIYRGFDSELYFQIDKDEWDLYDISNITNIESSFVDNISGGLPLLTANFSNGLIVNDIINRSFTISLPGSITKDWPSHSIEFDIVMDIIQTNSNPTLIPLPGKFTINMIERITNA